MKAEFLRETNREYFEFLRAEPIAPPKELSDRVLNLILKDLNPSPWRVFAKLSLIHFGVGIVTLSLCPQFGVRFFGEGMGLMRYFFHLGTYGCMAACGAFFVGVSLLVAALVLNREEVRTLRAHPWLQLAALVFLSLGAFIMADAEILLGFALAWVVGSLAGGFAALELGWQLRARMATS